jgi:hypothetical protein
VVAKADQILEQLRALTPAERLRVVEQVVHEVAAEVAPQQVGSPEFIWSDESDADFAAFRARIQSLRSTDVWRTGDEPNAR